MTGAPAALQLPGMNKSQEIGSEGENNNLMFIRNKILWGEQITIKTVESRWKQRYYACIHVCVTE